MINYVLVNFIECNILLCFHFSDSCLYWDVICSFSYEKYTVGHCYVLDCPLYASETWHVSSSDRQSQLRIFGFIISCWETKSVGLFDDGSPGIVKTPTPAPLLLEALSMLRIHPSASPIVVGSEQSVVNSATKSAITCPFVCSHLRYLFRHSFHWLGVLEDVFQWAFYQDGDRKGLEVMLQLPWCDKEGERQFLHLRISHFYI